VTSVYTPGLRSRDWIKAPHRQRSEFVIGGWLPEMGPNSGTVGALLVGAYMDGQLVFCGEVGAGLSATGALDVPSSVLSLCGREFRHLRNPVHLRHSGAAVLRPDCRLTSWCNDSRNVSSVILVPL